MDTIEQSLTLALDGLGLKKEDIITDVTVQPGTFVPLTKKTVTYIVGAIIFNDDGEVLMMQEAKPSCHGEWYLPAGRMEPNETLEQAVQREVLEESGLIFEPATILCVEAHKLWFRFTFFGRVTGGKLKSLAEKDAESLQAEWWPLSEVFSNAKRRLRSEDILPLIDLAAKHRSGVYHRHHNVLPVSTFHDKIILRMIIVCRPSSDRTKMQILIGRRSRLHFPTVVATNLRKAIFAFMNECGTPERQSFTTHGILSIEYDGRPAHCHDGMCITVLMSLTNEGFKITDPSCYGWMDIENGNIVQRIEQLLHNQSLPDLLCW